MVTDSGHNSLTNLHTRPHTPTHTGTCMHTHIYLCTNTHHWACIERVQRFVHESPPCTLWFSLQLRPVLTMILGKALLRSIVWDTTIEGNLHKHCARVLFMDTDLLAKDRLCQRIHIMVSLKRDPLCTIRQIRLGSLCSLPYWYHNEFQYLCAIHLAGHVGIFSDCRL